VPVFSQQREVLIEERVQLLFGQVGAAPAGLGPSLRTLVLGENAEVQVDVVLGVILAGCVAIAVLTSAVPAWLQLRPAPPPAGSIPG
jgi:hypothetical protein